MFWGDLLIVIVGDCEGKEVMLNFLNIGSMLSKVVYWFKYF